MPRTDFFWGATDLMVFWVCFVMKGGGERKVTNDVRREGRVVVEREGDARRKRKKRGSKY